MHVMIKKEKSKVAKQGSKRCSASLAFPSTPRPAKNSNPFGRSPGSRLSWHFPSQLLPVVMKWHSRIQLRGQPWIRPRFGSPLPCSLFILATHATKNQSGHPMSTIRFCLSII